LRPGAVQICRASLTPDGKLDEESNTQLEEEGWMEVEDTYGPDWASRADFDFTGPAPDIEFAGSKVLRILERDADGRIKVKFQSGSIQWTNLEEVCKTPELLRAYLACCGIRPKLA
jgi:hypothetical protein